MFLRKSKKPKPTPPIIVAEQMLRNAMIIACGYFSNKRYIPTEEDLKMFKIFAEELEISFATVTYITSELYQRSNGSR